MSFCTQCGTKSEDTSAFCTNCGARLNAHLATSKNVPSSRNAQPESPPQNRRTSGTAARPKGRTVLLWVCGAIVAFLAEGAVGAFYVGRSLKERISAKLRSSDSEPRITKDSARQVPGSEDSANDESGPQPGKIENQDEQMGKGLDAIGGLFDKFGFGDKPADPFENLPTLTPGEAGKLSCPIGSGERPYSNTKLAAGDNRIPFRENLVLTAAWWRKFGDAESSSAISSIQPNFVEVSNSGTYFKSDDDRVGAPDAAHRDVCWQDLEDAHGYITEYRRSYPLIAPGTTSSFLSSSAFRELKTQGKTTLRYLLYYGNSDDGFRLHWQEAVLTRVEPEDVAYPVIVNNDPKTVPAIHAKGTMLSVDSKARESREPLDQPLPTEIMVLDDPDNPIMLLYRMEIGSFRIQVIHISFPEEKPEKTIESGLAKNKKVVVYGIYFDYNSDQIKKESEPVLKEIAQALKDNPDWKLTVDGHTDNIGGDAYNLELSKRRAAAVKNALVSRFQVNANRLTTDGFGMRRPVDRNDTLEGRARNRRVELTRND